MVGGLAETNKLIEKRFVSEEENKRFRRVVKLEFRASKTKVFEGEKLVSGRWNKPFPGGVGEGSETKVSKLEF